MKATGRPCACRHGSPEPAARPGHERAAGAAAPPVFVECVGGACLGGVVPACAEGPPTNPPTRVLGPGSSLRPPDQYPTLTFIAIGTCRSRTTLMRLQSSSTVPLIQLFSDPFSSGLFSVNPPALSEKVVNGCPGSKPAPNVAFLA